MPGECVSDILQAIRRAIHLSLPINLGGREFTPRVLARDASDNHVVCGVFRTEEKEVTVDLGGNPATQGSILEERVYVGKAKVMSRTTLHGDKPLMINAFSDYITVFNDPERIHCPGKGAINNAFSAQIMALLSGFGIPTHHIETIDESRALVRPAQVLPFEFTVRNYCAGRSISTRWRVQNGDKLPQSLCELMLKDDSLGDPLISEEQALRFGLTNVEGLRNCKSLAYRINDMLSAYLLAKGIILADFKLEFGIIDGELALVDEISPDTCRLWDAQSRQSLDKDILREQVRAQQKPLGLDTVMAGYKEALRRIL
jgi:phosphoribosylaminoimidazole-succinocarboxamide synthase